MKPFALLPFILHNFVVASGKPGLPRPLTTRAGISTLTLIAGDQVHRDFSNASCPINCQANTGTGFLYGWASPQDGLPHPLAREHVEWTSMAATVITQINTVVHTTEIVTILPSGWTPPLTNAAGTQVWVITSGSSTTTLYVTPAPTMQLEHMWLMKPCRAFPSAFVGWPSNYELTGTMWDAEATQCVTATGGKWTTITDPGPQPTQPIDLDTLSYRNSTAFGDPKGLFAVPVLGQGASNWPAWAFDFELQGRSILSCEAGEAGGPAWGGLLTTWAVSTSTVYTG